MIIDIENFECFKSNRLDIMVTRELRVFLCTYVGGVPATPLKII